MAIKPDVVIAGAGPAGSTAGYLLAGLGFRVLLLEKSEFPRYRIGESLTPSILSILDFLKLRQTVEREEFLRMPRHTVCWGSPEPRTGYYSPDKSRMGFRSGEKPSIHCCWSMHADRKGPRSGLAQASMRSLSTAAA